jgi:hypothetical protein
MHADPAAAQLSPGADRALRSPEPQRSIGRRTLDSATGAASRQVGGLPRKCRRRYLPRPCTGGTSVRRRLDAQPYASPPDAFSCESRAKHRSVMRASVLVRSRSIGAARPLFLHPSPIRAGSFYTAGRGAWDRADWPACPRGTGHRGSPHAGQARAFAESDGLGEAMPRTSPHA